MDEYDKFEKRKNRALKYFIDSWKFTGDIETTFRPQDIDTIAHIMVGFTEIEEQQCKSNNQELTE